MGLDSFYILFSSIIFLVYGTICIVCIIFTFFLDLYLKLDEKLNLNVISNKILTPLDINIDKIDAWLIERNRIVGPLLMLLSLVDMKLSFNIIGML